MITSNKRVLHSLDAKADIEKNDDLFALSGSVLKILELTQEEDVNLEDIADVIRQDPALTGRLLKVANSPFYGMNQRISNPLNAVMALGLNTVKCLALSVTIFNHTTISKDLEIDLKALYGNIIAVATTSRKLAKTCRFCDSDEAFVCGMLHKIGLLFFIQHYPDAYSEITKAVKKGADWKEEENKAFGISHAEAGGIIARRWKLPDHVVSAITNHQSFGYKDSAQLNDIIRLSVALNLEYKIGDCDFEEKISRIYTLSERLGIETAELNEIIANSLSETFHFAKIIDLDIGEPEDILARANQEIFNTYMSILKLFKERQDLTRNILNEERQRGISEAKTIAISTLSHYINNSSMIISGQSQVLRLMLTRKSPDEMVSILDKALGIIDDAVKKTVAVLEEISELNMLDDVEFFDQSKILNIDDRINERLEKLKEITIYHKINT